MVQAYKKLYPEGCATDKWGRRTAVARQADVYPQAVHYQTTGKKRLRFLSLVNEGCEPSQRFTGRLNWVIEHSLYKGV